jgi:hypothetical protein
LLNGWLKGDIAAQFIMDIISYGDKDTQDLIFNHMEEELNKSKGDASSKIPMTIICHSLGTVIAADFIRERQTRQGCVHNNYELVNFFTMGSPVQLFSLQYGDKPLYKTPVRCENPDGQWINIFDKDDPIAYRLKEVYEDAVSEDREVDAGISVNSHIGYWNNQDVYVVIAQKLAED